MDMLQHLLGLETAGVTRASRLTGGDREQQALTAAVTAGHSEVAEFLFQLPSVSIHKADSRAGLTPLAAAVTSGHRRLVEWVLRHKAQLTSEVIIMAVEAGHEDILELLSHGADFRVRNDRGQSLLHLAASRGHCAILRRLLEMTSDDLGMMEADSEGLSPLTSAILGDQVILASHWSVLIT
ncbi:MAG: ankyrin repeat domain-containing protein [Candidatus Thalassarchaeaceae archaeon]